MKTPRRAIVKDINTLLRNLIYIQPFMFSDVEASNAMHSVAI